MPKKAETKMRGESTEANFNWRRAISLTLDKLHESDILGRATVVLIGSYAQAKPSWRSDVDLLVIFDGRRPRLDAPRGIHLQFVDTQAFGERATRGDDYAIAAVRFGKMLHDGLGVWQTLREAVKDAPLPDWRLKFEFARRRLKLTRELLQHHDVDAAREEYLAAATQLARGYLLRRGVYPFSRTQLSDQLDAVGQDELAQIMRLLLGLALEEVDLNRIAARLEEMASADRSSDG